MKIFLGFAILVILGILLVAAEAQNDQGEMRSSRGRDGRFLGLFGLGLGLGYPYGYPGYGGYGGYGQFGYGYGGYPYGNYWG